MIGKITGDLYTSLDAVPESKAARAELLRLATDTARWMALEAPDAQSLSRLAYTFMLIAQKEGAFGDNSVGNLEQGVALMDEAIAMTRRAIELDPDWPHPRWVLALMLNNRGGFEPDDQAGACWKDLALEANREAAAHSPKSFASAEERRYAESFAFVLMNAANGKDSQAEGLALMDEADALIDRCLAGDPDNVNCLLQRSLQHRIRAGFYLQTDPLKAIELARAAREEFRELLPRTESDTPVFHIGQSGWTIADALIKLRRFEQADQEFQAAHEWLLNASREKPSNTHRLHLTWLGIHNYTTDWTNLAGNTELPLEERHRCLARARRAFEQAREVQCLRVKALLPGTIITTAEQWFVDQEKLFAEVEARLPK
jgi:tetratricopeptide (TPR) repeat protein